MDVVIDQAIRHCQFSMPAAVSIIGITDTHRKLLHLMSRSRHDWPLNAIAPRSAVSDSNGAAP